MNAIAQLALAAYDALQRNTLDLATLARHAAPASGGDRDALRNTLAQLVREGLLRSAGRFDEFSRTEDGRLAVARPLDVTLYTRAGCHLCDEAKAAMAPLLREFRATLHEVDIDADEALRERYTNDVPVIFLGAHKAAKHHVDLAQFRRQLVEAARL